MQLWFPIPSKLKLKDGNTGNSWGFQPSLKDWLYFPGEAWLYLKWNIAMYDSLRYRSCSEFGTSSTLRLHPHDNIYLPS